MSSQGKTGLRACMHFEVLYTAATSCRKWPLP